MNNNPKETKRNNWTEIKTTLKKYNESNLLDNYKIQIKNYLAPSEPWKNNQQISIKNAKKTLNEYKKASPDNKIGLIDLMIHYVECGTDFICEFGDMHEQYYISLESVFENTLKLMNQFDNHEIQNFLKRLQTVVEKADLTGWGYCDTISEMLNGSYPKLKCF